MLIQVHSFCWLLELSGVMVMFLFIVDYSLTFSLYYFSLYSSSSFIPFSFSPSIIVSKVEVVRE